MPAPSWGQNSVARNKSGSSIQLKELHRMPDISEQAQRN